MGFATMTRVYLQQLERGHRQCERLCSETEVTTLMTGIGVVGAVPRERIFDLELAQRWLVTRSSSASRSIPASFEP